MLRQSYLENLRNRIESDLRAPTDSNGSHYSSRSDSHFIYMPINFSFGHQTTSSSTPPVYTTTTTTFMSRANLSKIAPF